MKIVQHQPSAQEKKLALQVNSSNESEKRRLASIVTAAKSEQWVCTNSSLCTTCPKKLNKILAEVVNPWRCPTKVTADMTGFGASSIRRWKIEQMTKDSLGHAAVSGRPSKRFPGWAHISIRNIITGFYGYKGGKASMRKYPTVANVMDEFYEMHPSGDDAQAGDILRVSESSFRKEIKKAGFKFVGGRGHTAIISRDDVAADRFDFLRTISRLVAEGRPIYFTDETWCNLHHQRERMWRGTKVNPVTGRTEFLEGGMATLPAGEGSRIIICHIMSKDGLVDGAADVFEGVKKSQDYHQEMNSDHYENWIREKVLPNLPEKSVLVIDKASYHNRLTEESKKPKSSWKKADVVQWLVSKGSGTEADLMKLTVPELLSKCSRYHVDAEYRVDKILAEKGITVLRLPTKHCEYNPIELVWARVKRQVASRNTTSLNKKELIALINSAFDSIDAEFCQKVTEHCFRIMDAAKEAEKMVDVEVRPLIIDLLDDDADEDAMEDEPDLESGLDWGANDGFESDDMKETEAIERAILQAAQFYNVTSVIKDATKCQCSKNKVATASDGGASTTRAPRTAGTCKNCSCSKADARCGPLCSCDPAHCLNRIPDIPDSASPDTNTQNQAMLSDDEDDFEALHDLNTDSQIAKEVELSLKRDKAAHSDLHLAIIGHLENRAKRKLEIIAEFKEAEEARKRPALPLTTTKPKCGPRTTAIKEVPQLLHDLSLQVHTAGATTSDGSAEEKPKCGPSTTPQPDQTDANIDVITIDEDGDCNDGNVTDCRHDGSGGSAIAQCVQLVLRPDDDSPLTGAPPQPAGTLRIRNIAGGSSAHV